MDEATKHRGPDGTAIKAGAAFTFGHNRLAVLDLSHASNQPMTSQDSRYVIVFNGEIYNFRALKEELKTQYKFQTKGDTEVLLAAYQAWGEDCLNKLRGIFAFAIYDKQDDSLLLARDQMGVKPLYYSDCDGVLIFSSELAGITAAGKRQLDLDSLSLYLSLQYVPSPQTLVKGVKKLQPGEMLRYKAGRVELANYAEKPPQRGTGSDLSTYDVLDQAVKKQLVSDREVGVFLSGGLDSSIVLHHTKENLSDVKTFSMGFELEDNSSPNEEKFNYDLRAAAKTAKHYGSTHHELILTHQTIAEHLEEAFAALDEPVANPTSVSKYLLSQFVRDKGVVVALGGDGGDEMFIGYPRHKLALAAADFQCLPAGLRNIPAVFSDKFKKLNTPLGPAFHRMITANKNQTALRSVLKTDLNSIATEEMYKNKYDAFAPDLKGADAFVEIDRLTWLPDESLHSSDRASMADGLEYRVPFLDLDVYRYAQSFSLRKHTSYWEGKKMLTAAYRDKLPEHLFDIPKKGWFSPGAKWLRNESILAVVSNIISDEYYDGFSDIINWPEVQKLLDRHVNQKEYHLYPIWNLMQLQVWGKKNNINL